MSGYIEIRCPSKTRPNDERSCNHILGGANPKHELDEIRYCSACNIFWEIKSKDNAISMTEVKERIEMAPLDKLGLILVIGGQK